MSEEKLEIASKRIVALQQELRALHEKHSKEIADLKTALQEANKIAAAAQQKIKHAEENARNAKERGKRLKRKIERIEGLDMLKSQK